jgi:hypothetical protein
MAILTEATLLCKIVGWQSTVVEKRQSVRICETEPELTVSETDRWVELTTKREFFDYAIPLAVENINANIRSGWQYCMRIRENSMIPKLPCSGKVRSERLTLKNSMVHAAGR